MQDPIGKHCCSDWQDRGDSTDQISDAAHCVAPVDRLLLAALAEFANLGFDGASTRVIAKAADMPMSAITYHFRSKQGLYRAAVARAATKLAEQRNPPNRFELATPTPSDAQSMFKEELAAFGKRLCDPSNTSELLLVAREQIAPTTAFQTVYGEAIKPLLDRLAWLAGIAIGRDDGWASRSLASYFFGCLQSTILSRSIDTLFLRPSAAGMRQLLVELSVDAVFEAKRAVPPPSSWARDVCDS